MASCVSKLYFLVLKSGRKYSGTSLGSLSVKRAACKVPKICEYTQYVDTLAKGSLFTLQIAARTAVPIRYTFLKCNG